MLKSLSKETWVLLVAALLMALTSIPGVHIPWLLKDVAIDRLGIVLVCWFGDVLLATIAIVWILHICTLDGKEVLESRFRLVPGILLLILVGASGRIVEWVIAGISKEFHLTQMPNIDYVLWAILIGLAIANTVGRRLSFKKIFEPGIETYDWFLKVGIIFMGERFLLKDMFHLAGWILPLTAFEILLGLGLITYIGKKMGLDKKLTILIATGCAVCGVSAIIAMMVAIGAKKEDGMISITSILGLGLAYLTVMPLVGQLLHMTSVVFGVIAGLSVDNTAEVIAVGRLFSPDAERIAGLTKLVRNAYIGPIVLIYAAIYARQSFTKGASIAKKVAFAWEKSPKFVIGFVIASALASFGIFTLAQIVSAGNLSQWFLMVCFGGIGLVMYLPDLFKKENLKPFALAILGGLGITVVNFAVVMTIDALIPGGLQSSFS